MTPIKMSINTDRNEHTYNCIKIKLKVNGKVNRIK